MSSTRRCLVSILVLNLFLITQFVSMFGGIELIANIGDYDNVDDISLEDVVPLDPFLSGSALKLSESLPLSGGSASPLFYQPDWHFDLVQSQQIVSHKWDDSNSPVKRHEKGLWLLNRALLI